MEPKKQMDETTAREQLSKREKKAEVYLHDPKKMQRLIKEAAEKMSAAKGPLDGVLGEMATMLSLMRDWVNGSYRAIPVGSIVMIVATILYFVSPLDFIPDFIPFAGFSDDAVIVAFAWKQIKSDLKKYELWKENLADEEPEE